MKHYDLHISNHNYYANEFLARIQERFARDDRLLSTVLVRSALTRAEAGQVAHIMTCIDVLGASHQMETRPRIVDYGAFLFVRENLTKESLLQRLNGLTENQFQVGQWTIKSDGLGFSDYYEPSGNQYSEWPCTVFQISFARAQFPFDPLIHPELKSFGSPYEAIRENLGLAQFNDSSDGRLGSIMLSVPNFNARIEQLVLMRNKLTVKLSGIAPPNSLKLDGSYKSERAVASIERHLDSKETFLELSFIPSQLQLWLISIEGFLADFHDENEYYSRGANPVLPKKPAGSAPASWQLGSPETLEAAHDLASVPNRVFIVHGHNTPVKESVARFLEKLGVEAIILHEQPNKGNTIMEKFELHSEVSFAIALMTGDDEARGASSNAPLRRRPRQNVLFEFGYFIGKLGRDHVCALVDKDVEIPSDYQGVVYIDLDPTGHWKFDLVRELKAVGFDVDANRAL